MMWIGIAMFSWVVVSVATALVTGRALQIRDKKEKMKEAELKGEEITGARLSGFNPNVH